MAAVSGNFKAILDPLAEALDPEKWEEDEEDGDGGEETDVAVGEGQSSGRTATDGDAIVCLSSATTAAADSDAAAATREGARRAGAGHTAAGRPGSGGSGRGGSGGAGGANGTLRELFKAELPYLKELSSDVRHLVLSAPPPFTLMWALAFSVCPPSYLFYPPPPPSLHHSDIYASLWPPLPSLPSSLSVSPSLSSLYLFLFGGRWCSVRDANLLQLDADTACMCMCACGGAHTRAASIASVCLHAGERAYTRERMCAYAQTRVSVRTCMRALRILPRRACMHAWPTRLRVCMHPFRLRGDVRPSTDVDSIQPQSAGFCGIITS
jgi:hypothetical protein